MTTPFVPSADAPPLARGRTWEEMPRGLVFKTAARTITESDLMTFLTLGGFNEALFFDASHASASGYTGRLVPGALTYCIAEGLIIQTNILNGTGMAFLGMDMSVTRPVYVDDTLLAVCTIIESRATSKPGRGLVTTRVSVRNQRDEEVLVFTPVRMIRGTNSPDVDQL